MTTLRFEHGEPYHALLCSLVLICACHSQQSGSEKEPMDGASQGIVRILILPEFATVEAGGAVEFLAEVHDAEGERVEAAIDVWRSSDEGVVSLEKTAGESGQKVRAIAKTTGEAVIEACTGNGRSCGSAKLVVTDITPPSFGGLISAETVSTRILRLRWLPATDNGTAQESLIYEICRATESGGCSTLTFGAAYTTNPGDVSFVADDLLPGTRYFFVARAKDSRGNRDSNVQEQTALTLSSDRLVGLAGGGVHMCGLLSDGTMACWGDNTFGQIGDGTTVGATTPVLVSGISGVVAASSGEWHTCALTAQGSISCWGRNVEGEVGDGTRVDRRSPVVVGGVSGAIGLAAYGFTTCAVLSDGTVKCWGINNAGQLGRGTSSGPNQCEFQPGMSTPCGLTPEVVSSLSGVVSLVAGGTHVCAAVSDGSVRCWGGNNHGELGDGTQAPKSTPVTVPGLTGVVGLAAGAAHSCALLTDGSVRCWGWNKFGQLGVGGNGGSQPCRSMSDNSACSMIPVTVTGLTGAVSITARVNYSCALLADGTARCWGANGGGHLGDGTRIDQSAPVVVSGLNEVVALEASGLQTCALGADGILRCWGAHNMATTDPRYAMPAAAPSVARKGSRSGSGLRWSLHRPNRALVAGNSHACAASPDGSVRCWGNNSSGQLGVGRSGSTQLQPTVSKTRGVVSLSAGENHTCSLQSTGIVQCWGLNSDGQLGDGTAVAKPTPTQVSLLTSVVSVSAGYHHTCAVLSTGEVQCWGNNQVGQLGDGTTVNRMTPVKVVGLPLAVEVAAGGSHTCAIVSDRSVQCWGGNSSGALGMKAGSGPQTCGLDSCSVGPVTVLGLTGAIGLASSSHHACAVLADGTVRCWGENSLGWLGNGTAVSAAGPVAVSGVQGVLALAVRSGVTCATLADGTTRCWGENSSGQLGDGTTVNRPAPVGVQGVTDAVEVVVGGGFACALLAEGGARCWGSNVFGGLGNRERKDGLATGNVPFLP